MDVLRLFLIFHLLDQICFGSKTERKKRVGYLVKTRAGKTFLLHTTKKKKDLPKMGGKSVKKDENLSRGRKMTGHNLKKVKIVSRCYSPYAPDLSILLGYISLIFSTNLLGLTWAFKECYNF